MAYQILVVDDEPALRMMVQEILTQAGYAVCLAGSCREALTQRAQVHPDAILLDVMLPDGDGFSLLGQLRQQGDVPVLFLSARDEDEARLRGLGLGADDYITKPFWPRSCCCGCMQCSAGCTAPPPRRSPPGWAARRSIGGREPSGGMAGRSPSPPRSLPC